MFKVLTIIFVLALNLVSSFSYGNEHLQVTLDDGRIILVNAGVKEPRSIGSYSLRLYQPLNKNYPFDNYVHGLMAKRDGMIEKLILADLTHNSKQELIVLIRSVGSGGYLSGQAYSISKTKIKRLKALDNIDLTKPIIEQFTLAESSIN